jgi:hypothetical protein
VHRRGEERRGEQRRGEKGRGGERRGEVDVHIVSVAAVRCDGMIDGIPPGNAFMMSGDVADG